MGWVRVGHNSRKHGQRGAQWHSVHHTDSLRGDPGWGPTVGVCSLHHRSIPILHITFTLTGDHTALCKSRLPSCCSAGGGRGPQGSERPGHPGLGATVMVATGGATGALHDQVPKELMWLMRRSSVFTLLQPPVCWTSSVPAKPGQLDLLSAESEVPTGIPPKGIAQCGTPHTCPGPCGRVGRNGGLVTGRSMEMNAG